MNEELEQLFTDGQLKCMQGDLDSGIETFNCILEKQPLAKAYQARAACYAKKERVEDALKDIDAAIKIEPQNAKLFYHKAVLLMSKERTEEAFNAIEKAIELSPEVPAFYVLRSKIFEKTGDEENASIDMHRATNLQKSQSKLVDW
ncbi:MAG: tetratricopeptide repeat protein [Dissulfuribacterales bacterium]